MIHSPFLKTQLSFFADLTGKKKVLLALVQRDIQQRYASSYLGIAWAVLQPLATIAVYTIVFSMVFRASVPASYNEVPYVIFLMCGLIPYQIFSETIRRSTNVLINNKNMITKMVFPYELLPVATLVTAFVTGGITLILTVLFMLVLGVLPTFSYLVYLPAFLIPLILLTTGLAWLVSCVSVVVRDIGHVVPVALHLLLFATPILYSYEMVEKGIAHHPRIVALAKLNPLYSIAVGHKIALVGNEFVLDSHTVLTSYIVCIVVFITGGVVFNLFKRDLADWF